MSQVTLNLPQPIFSPFKNPNLEHSEEMLVHRFAYLEMTDVRGIFWIGIDTMPSTQLVLFLRL